MINDSYFNHETVASDPGAITNKSLEIKIEKYKSGELSSETVVNISLLEFFKQDISM